MTHPTQESLDEAARKAGYRDWEDAQEYADGDISEKASIIAVATTLDEFAAYKQEVSDAVGYAIPLIETWVGNSDEAGRKAADRLRCFILPKPDPLVEAWQMAFPGNHIEDARDECAKISAAIENCGGKIVWGEG
jgi:hypothetical protein